MKYLRRNIVLYSAMVAFGLLIRANYSHMAGLWTASLGMTRDQWHSRLGFEVVGLLLTLLGASALFHCYADYSKRLLEGRPANDIDRK